MSFTYINEDDIDLELKCMICNDPFQSPVNCVRCGQTFCQECIDQWYRQQTSCPACRQNGYLFVPVITRILLNQLNRLLVQCSLCQQTNIERSNFPTHAAVICPKQIVVCTDQCGWKGRRENLERHLSKCRKKQSSRWWNIFTCLSIFWSYVFLRLNEINMLSIVNFFYLFSLENENLLKVDLSVVNWYKKRRTKKRCHILRISHRIKKRNRWGWQTTYKHHNK